MLTEVLSLGVGHLAELPVATLLVLRSTRIRYELAWTTSGRAYSSARAARRIPFSPIEYEAVALAVELERLHLEDLAGLAARKARDVAFRIDAGVAMAGAWGIVPHFEIYEERRVGRSWKYCRKLDVRGVAVDVARPGLQSRTSLTFAQLFARLELELVDVQLGPFAAAAAPASTTRTADLGPIGAPEM